MKNPSKLLIVSLFALAPQGCSHAVSTGASPDPLPTLEQQAKPLANAPPTAPAPVYHVPLDGLPSIGSPDALVTVVEFTDYECPYCQRAEETMAKLRATYGESLRVVVAALPLPIHTRARPAALAALAADAQGRFAAMHEHLLALHGSLSDGAITAAAQAAGLDMTRFATDTAAASLATSEGLAKRLGVTGTPSFFIGGRHVVGAQPYETFRDTIDERLVAARALVAGGVRPRDVYAAMTAGGAERVVANKDDGACGGDDCNDGPDEPTVTEGKVESVPIAGAPTRGPARASITIVSFGDFECPFSAKAEAILRAVEVAHPGEVRVVFKNLPLPMHPNARLAAAAALAADEQGRFWEFHDRLYARTGTPLDREALLQIATDVGLNTARLSHDLDDPGLAARLDRDKADAEMLGVKGTPTFFVNGRRIVGAQPVTTFEAAIAKGTKG